MKLIDLSADLSGFKLYFTSVARANATCRTDACAALPAGGAGEDHLEKYIADNLPSWIAADFAPLEAHDIDEDTYVEQARDLEARYGNAVVRYVLGQLQAEPDLAMVGYPATDELSHQFLGPITPTDLDGRPNEFYDNLDGQGPPDGGSRSAPAISAAPTTRPTSSRACPAAHARRRGRDGPAPTTGSAPPGRRSTPARSSLTSACSPASSRATAGSTPRPRPPPRPRPATPAAPPRSTSTSPAATSPAWSRWPTTTRSATRSSPPSKGSRTRGRPAARSS